MIFSKTSTGDPLTDLSRKPDLSVRPVKALKRNGVLLLMLFSLACCEKEIDSPANELLLKTWTLVSIDDGKEDVVFDSVNCVDDVAYGYHNGMQIELNSTLLPQPTKFDDYRLSETWNFFSTDSLSIFRKGNEPAHWECMFGEPQLLVLTGFEIFNYYAARSISNDDLSVSMDEGIYRYSIVGLSEDSLILDAEFGNKRLIFKNDL